MSEWNKSCPCEFVTPCSPRCICANPVQSGGCKRCCKYGSEEQQRAKAEFLASTYAMDRPAPRLSHEDLDPAPVAEDAGGPQGMAAVEMTGAEAMVKLQQGYDEAEYPAIRAALQTAAGKWIDQGQTVHAWVALNEVKRLDKQFGGKP